MKEFSAYIDYCEQQFRNTTVCQNCPYGQCIHPCPSINGQNCYACLNKIHYYLNEDLSYQCDRITYNYVLKHGHRYASEMDQVLGLIKQSYHFSNEINIFSVGCGPCTELFGIVKQFGDIIIHFKGFDLNPIWNRINDFEKGLFPDRDIQFYLDDFFAYMAKCDDHVDILILNYMLSDLARYKSPDICSAFIDNLVALCEQRRVSSIAINDVYLCYSEKTGYVLMEELARKLQHNKNIDEKIGRGRFATPKLGQPIYGKYKGSEDLTFPIVEKSVQPFSPFPTCGSILMLALFQ